MMILLFAAALLAATEPPPVETIMARVAENQTRAQEARRLWIYQQSVLVRLHRANGKLSREELREYIVTPMPKGTEKKLQHFAGKYEDKGKLHEYSEPGYEHKDIDIDADLAKDLAEDLANGEDTKDGIAGELFPLTPMEQDKYIFTLHGQETYREQKVYKVNFRPKPGQEDGIWKGEALIDVNEFQPLLITTTLGKHIPLAVRTILGTNLEHMGFKVTYQKLAGDVWFPATYGGEFYLRAVFFYKRKISLAVNNTDFRKADVTSTVIFEKQ